MGVTECPKTVITPFSLMCLEGFFAARLGVVAGEGWDRMASKAVDAWQVLAEELRKEEQND